MKSAAAPLKARQYVDQLATSSRYTFTTAEARAALGLSPGALKVALNRLARRKLIASPVRGFHIIVPPEYRSLGCLPADQFVPALMKALDLPYYAALLTASEYHGAAHQRPQEFQVFVEKSRRPLVCGRVRVAFIVRKNLRKVPVQSLNTPRGVVLVSTPEATAFDLVGYQDRACGLDNVATVLAELAEKLDPKKLVAVAKTAPLPWAQRLGYLLERVNAAGKAEPLKEYVRARAHDSAALLLPAARRKEVCRDDVWKLLVNAQVESEI